MNDNKRNAWTEEELQYIRDHYQEKSDQEIAEHLGTHTTGSVATKRKRMKLNRSKKKFFFQDVVNEFNKTSYILLSTEEEYKDTATNSLRYICPKHKDKGIQTISLGHLKSGRGCYYCGREITEAAHRVDEDINEKECKALCTSKGFEYQGWFRENGVIMINYICSKHPQIGIQKMRKGNMSREQIQGCPYCFDTKKFKFSKGEKRVEEILNQMKISFIPQYTFEDCKDVCKLPFDYYLPDLKICIEYDGQHHFYPVTFNGISQEAAQKSHESTKKHDKIKDQYCADNNIRILQIPYYDFKNIEVIIRDFLDNK